MPRLQQHGLKASPGQARVQPLRERPRLQPDPGQRQAELAEEADQRLRLATLASPMIRPLLSTTHTLLRSSDTSIPA